MRQRLLEESKASQLKQIEDRERQRLTEQDREEMWNVVASRSRQALVRITSNVSDSSDLCSGVQPRSFLCSHVF